MPRTLPSTSTAALFFALLLVTGVILWIVGGRLARSSRAASPSVALTWTRVATGSDDAVDYPTRLDLVERLAMVAQPWCVDALQQAMREESDATMRDAADRALLVIAARAE